MIINQQPPSGGGGGGKYVAICNYNFLVDTCPSSNRQYCLELDAGSDLWVRIAMGSAAKLYATDANGNSISQAETKHVDGFKYTRYIMPSAHVHVRREEDMGGGGNN